MSESSLSVLSQARTLLMQLSRPQRLSLGALALLIPGTLFWLTVRAPDERWIPLLNLKASGASLDETVSALHDAGIDDFREESGQLLVPESRLAEYHEVLKSVLNDSPAVSPAAETEDSGSGLFDWPDQRADRREDKLRRDICRLLMSIEGIEQAELRWAQATGRRGFRDPNKVTASVFVRLEPGAELNNSLVDLLKRSVASMITDLDQADVHIINRATGRLWDGKPDSIHASSLAATHTVDARFLRNVELRLTRALAWIPGIAVSVRPDSASKDESKARPDAHSDLQPGSHSNRPKRLTTEGEASTATRLLAVTLTLPNGASVRDETSRQRTESRVRRAVAASIPAGFHHSIHFETATASVAMPSESITTAASPASDPWTWGGVGASVILAGLACFRRRVRQDGERSDGDDETALSVAFEQEGGDTASVEEFDDPLEAENESHDPVLATAVNPDPPFRGLSHATAQELARLLHGEHPQTAAIVVRHLPMHLATDLARRLPESIQAEVVRRIASVDQVAADVVRELDESLCERYRCMKQNSPWSTVAPARQSTTAAHIPPPGKKLEDLLSVDDETFHRLVRQVDSSLWRAALPGTSRRLRNRIQHALPETGDTENEAPSLVVAGRIEDTRSAHRQILETLARLDGHSPDSVRTSTKREFVG